MGHVASQPLNQSLCWLLSRANHVLATKMTAALEELGLPPRHHQVLVTALGGEYTQIELARIVGLDKTTMVVTVDELEAQGLAERRPSKTDRRARIIAVTKTGQRRVLEANDVVARVHEEILETLPARERDVFLDALAKLVEGPLGEPVPCTQPVRRRAPRAAVRQ
ncbi:MAG: MarR family transcriptional regulator, transcriptional regulator for hemolysin [Solirubrobacteraceae bacterium]|jgi:MarR family transcriptional regulator for hemolysin|nr:MarR family transcriptional regulator, transcriptional regulator for hemolysin [Solirubrobacteraceae bacterium]